MIVLVGFALFAVLLFYAARAKRRGQFVRSIALLVGFGGVCIVVVMFGLLMAGFRGFG